MILHDFQAQGLIQTPKWLPDNCHYLTMMGSTVYGASNDFSDRDVYGFAMPPLKTIFPHLDNVIPGFGRQIQRFEVWQQHHVEKDEVEWDFSVYSIVKYFQLLMDNNPNILDSIMTPRNAVIHMTEIGQMIRDNKRMFVHKGCYGKFRGYAMSQMAKVRSKVRPSNPKRAAAVDQFGYDVKYALHLVRLCLECEQLLETGEMVLDKDATLYRKIRAGEWTLEYLEEWFAQKEKHLEELLNRSVIPYSPDEDAIKRLLLQCLEMHYGSLDKAIRVETPIDLIVRDLENLVARYK